MSRPVDPEINGVPEPCTHPSHPPTVGGHVFPEGVPGLEDLLAEQAAEGEPLDVLGLNMPDQ